MAQLTYKNESIEGAEKIAAALKAEGIHYAHWGLKSSDASEPEEILAAYSSEVETLKEEMGYIHQDVVALNNTLPKLDEICAKFDKLHHHTEDEVRFTVKGSGVFEIKPKSNQGDMFKFTAQAGDLIVVPKDRKHLFYLTDERNIQCIRLFKNHEGWEAKYD